MLDDRSSASDSDKVRQLTTGYQAARALLAADEIGLIEHLQGRRESVEQLAAEMGLHAPTLKRFLRALAAVDVVSMDEESRVSLGPLAEGLRDAARIGVENYRAWAELPYTLRTGKPAFDKVFGRGFYDYLDGEPEKAERFNAALTAVSRSWIPEVLQAIDFEGIRTVMDLGGGHGLFLAELLKVHPQVQGILVDQASVLARARELLDAEGVQDRCLLEPANFLQSVPPGADLITLCNLLTDWDNDHAVQILQNCRAAMGEEGRIVVVDRALPPPSDPAHRSVAFLDLFFLVMEGGCIRTEHEFAAIFEDAGFSLARCLPAGGGFYLLEGAQLGQPRVTCGD